MKKMRKRLGRAKLAKRRTQLAVIAAALGFASWSVWNVGGVGETCGVGNVGAVATARETSGTNRQIVPEPKDGKLESPTGLKAFIVGADDYRDATDLPCVRNDVEAFAARLIEVGFEEKNVAVLKTGGKFDDFPTKANVEERFEAFVENLRPGDFVVVYLSGHGVQPTDSKEAFFVPVDAKAEDPFGTSVSIDRMLAALDASQARFRWMIVDACRNDPTNARGIFKTRATGARGLSEIADAPKTTSLLQSCQPGKCSYEGGDGVANGVFTLSLLEAFDPKNSRADVDGDGALAFSEVLKYVSERTNELALELHGVSQKPMLSGEITDFAILDGLRVGPSGGGSGGAGGGSGWLPFALLALTGVAAGAAYWAGRRRGNPVPVATPDGENVVGPVPVSATQSEVATELAPVSTPVVVPSATDVSSWEPDAEDASRKAWEDAERRAESERRAREEAERKILEAERKAKEAEARAASERKAREASERADAERRAREETERKIREAERRAQEAEA
ncbi:MAG: caspase family protein, partial [Thermoguttaceae bacterium]|nr:caspase family protein [Thermoguttaceae bacterium]